MMLETSHDFEKENITWLQARIYEFAAKPVNLPAKWKKLVLNRAGQAGREIQILGSTLLWNSNVPFDHSRPWDLRGSLFFFNILRLHNSICGEFVQSAMYQEYLREKRVDLLIIDHFIQECFVAASSLLNTTSVMFSNWPVADGYLTAINIPANPAVVPKTGTAFSSIRMNFLDRLRNTVFHSLIVGARWLHACVVNYLFAQWGYPKIDLDQVQAKHLLYAARSEFLAESVRPLTNRLKHFGCVRCHQKSDYQILRPSSIGPVSKKSFKSHNSGMSIRNSSLSSRVSPIVLDIHKNMTLFMPTTIESKSLLCSRGCSIQLNETTNKTIEHVNTPELEEILNEGNLTEAEERYVRTQIAFKNLDLRILDEGPFILISFGSVAETRFMPQQLLDNFLRTFRRLSHLRFVWQINLDILERQQEIPENLQVFEWVPLKILLAHQNLIHVVTHGGVNTINELVFFGVPVFGVPLQGDQLSNVQRLRELGMADLVTVQELYQPNFFVQKLQQFHKNLPRLRRRARKVSSMVSTYRQLNGRNQHFWLHWALRHGKRIQSIGSTGHKRSFFEQELKTSFDYFCLKEIGLWSTIILFLLVLVGS